ncbi:hypothetical protein M9458_057963 [Cirrhinus mrigala]|uniref:Gypsy retrotransposon integrase-like protein 1 n=1 Tax=Cirrhinus mrigala TaxID=683832 RepID=A0ABD0MCC4_CIRMR
MSTETPLVNALKAVFQPPSTPPSVSGSPMAVPATFAGEAADKSLHQNATTTDDAKVAFLISLLTGKALLHYTLHFRTLVAASGWNEKALLGAYRQGLNPDLRAAMALYDDSIGLEAFLQRTTRVAQNLAACQPPITAPQPASVNPCKSTPHVCHVQNGTEESVMVSVCNVDNLVITSVNVPSDPTPRGEYPLYRDSLGNFISQDCLNQLQLARRPHHQVLSLKTIQGKPLGRGKIRYSSPIITLQVGLFHHEDIKFLVLEDSTASIILGCPWLQQHHPELSWDPCDVLHWSEHCSQHCLINVPRSSADHLILSSTLIESPDQASVPEVPAEYLAFQDVFTKQAATLLPPHRPWDCAIDLLPGAQLPKGRVYPLSIPERQAMEEYISEALAQGFIQPSTSPAASNFFFVGKKDGGLRPCIDYRQLNSQVIQQPYPLPLVPAALEELRGAQVFTKLDLRSAYNLVRIRAGDEWKTAFVTPTGHYEYRVMPYGLHQPIRLPNVYERGVPGVPPSVCDCLHRYLDLLPEHGRTSPPRPAGPPQAPRTPPLSQAGKISRTFLHGRGRRIHHWSRCGTVLIGRWPPLLHPCAFYSRKLSPVEQNYDVGNRELLAIKLALEEWRHWLEGSKHPFTIITDHNLQYIREAKRLNPRQARWALFFTRLNLKITYRPGSKNISADALSRLHSTDQPVEPEPIVPSNLIVSPIVWEMDEDIRSATLQEAAPPECPEGKIFVPLALRQDLLDTAHWSPGSGHPGSQRTLSLLQSHYWWPSMRRDTIRYVQSCSVCAMSTSPRQLPTGKLVTLPIPQRPWSHIGVDFVTDLPAAKGNTCILVMVDRFSKMCKFFPLKGLPTATETAEILFQHLFRHFGLPEEIVSDRGPQFISHVWKAFFKLLGVSVNLSSGYHPQTNGQTERKIQELGRYFRAYCHTDQHCWRRFLPWAEYTQNSLCQDTTDLTPFQCILWYQPPLFPWTEEPSNVPAVDHWFRESVGLSSSPSAAGCTTTQVLRRHPTETCPRIPTWGPGLVVYTGSPPPSTLSQAESPLHWPVQDPETHQRSHVPTSAPTKNNRELKCSPLLRRSWNHHPYTPSTRSWAHGVEGAGWNFSSTGRGMDLKSDPGSHGMTYWTPPCYLTSIETIRISLPLAVEVALDVVLGLREPPLEEGVVSGIHHCHPHLTRLR